MSPMTFLTDALAYIFTAANWGGPAGLAARIGEHLQYTVLAVVFSALIAVPIGMLIGHTGRGTFVIVTGVNALRALPTLGCSACCCGASAWSGRRWR